MTDSGAIHQYETMQNHSGWNERGSIRPPIYFIRHKDGLSAYSGASDLPHLSVEDEIFQSLWSPDGGQLIVNSSVNGLVVYRHSLWTNQKVVIEKSRSFKLIRFQNSPPFPARSLRHLQWSPMGSFVVAFWQYDSKASANGLDDRNVIVWKTTINNSSTDIWRTPINHSSNDVWKTTINDSSTDIWRTPIKKASTDVGKSTINNSSTDNLSTSLLPVAAFTLKGLSMGQWPILKWRNDEKFCLLSSRSEVVIFDGFDVGGSPLMRIPLSGIISTEPAPFLKDSASASAIEKDGLVFAAFSPASSSAEGDALFRVLVIREVRRKTGTDDWHIAVQKPLGFSDSAELSWSPSGTTVLVLASTTVDAAGENYGGVGDVYLARFDGTLTVKVNKAVAQAACWNPCRDEFIVIEGKSPSEMYLYDKDCNIQYEFPVAYRNTVRWDCFGLMVALGGFGNLAGDLSFWFRDTETRCMQIIADWREPCTVLCGWSPDGRHFFTASTFPRMKVDNHFKVFTYEGNLLTEKVYNQLFDFQWKPDPPGMYRVPPRPSQQGSAITAAKKFKSAKDIAIETKGENRRFQAGRGRKEGQVTGVPTSTNATAMLPTAAQAAKMERNRQLDSISDWRAAPKESETASVTSDVTLTKRRGSVTKPKSEERAVMQEQPSGAELVTRQNPAENDKATTANRTLLTRQQPPPNEKLSSTISSTKTRSGALTPSDLQQPPPTTSQVTEQDESTTAHAWSPSARDFNMLSSGTRSHQGYPNPHDNNENANILSVPPQPFPSQQTPFDQLSSQPPTNIADVTSLSSPVSLPSNNTGLLGLLKSILPPEASVHVSRDLPGRQATVDYDTDFPLLDNSRAATLSCLRSNPTELQIASQLCSTDYPPPPPHNSGTSAKPFHENPLDFSSTNINTTDRVESLVKLLVRAQKEKLSQLKQPSNQAGSSNIWQQLSSSNVDPNSNNQSNTQNFYKDQLLESLLRAQQLQQQQRTQTSNHFPKVPVPQTEVPNLRLFHELQHRFKQSRGDPQQQAAILQALVRLQQQRGQVPVPQQTSISPLDAGSHSDWPSGHLGFSDSFSDSFSDRRLEPNSHVFSSQCPAHSEVGTKWEYVDQKGVIRGPFDIQDMRKWSSMGYFEPSLPIRCTPDENFTPLCHMFPLGTAFGIPLPNKKHPR